MNTIVTLFEIVGALAFVVISCIEQSPRLLWNASNSIPAGLYVMSPGSLRIESIAVLRLPPLARRLAARRRYLPANAVLLKPVAAMAGDRVCRWQGRVLINGEHRAEAAFRDFAGRLLPIWQGCRRLQQDELFVLSTTSGSFDSRYFGPVRQDAVIGIARPLVTF